MSENRTNEFLVLARNVKGTALSSSDGTVAAGGGAAASRNTTSNNSSNKTNHNNNNSSNFQEVRNFHAQASGISKDIASTSALLTQLTEKVKHKSLLFHDEDSMVVNQLVVRIKQNIENLNSRLDNAQKTIAEQKTKQRSLLYGRGSSSTNNSNSSSSSQQAVEASANLVSGLQNEFAMAASTFKDILQQRTESLKEDDEYKRKLYYGTNNNNNGSATGQEDDDLDDIPDMTSHLLLQNQPPVFGSATDTLNADGRGSSSLLFPTLDLTSSIPTMGGIGGSSTMMGVDGGGGALNGGSSLPRPHGIASPSNGGNSGGNNSYYNRSNSAPITSLTNSSSLGPTSSSPSSYSTMSSNYQQQMLQRRPNASSSTSTSAISILTPFDMQQMEEESGSSQLLQLLPTTTQNESYLQSRTDAMTTVESNIVELGTIFTKLAGLVNEHREMVQRVEDNVEDTHSNVLLSMNVLTDTLHNLRTNKMLTLKIFSILIAFIILFIVFFA